MSPIPHTAVIAALLALCIGLTSQAARAGDDKNTMIQFFQNHISSADGNRCPMTPSCSEYAARAIKKHGMVMGWVMACDRLVRCGRDEVGISPHIRINAQDYVYDPVSANDFWWFNRPEEKTEPE